MSAFRPMSLASTYPAPLNAMTELPQCPKCASAYTYDDGHQYVCPECAHEWPREAATAPVEQARVSEFVKKST